MNLLLKKEQNQLRKQIYKGLQENHIKSFKLVCMTLSDPNTKDRLLRLGNSYRDLILYKQKPVFRLVIRYFKNCNLYTPFIIDIQAVLKELKEASYSSETTRRPL